MACIKGVVPRFSIAAGCLLKLSPFWQLLKLELWKDLLQPYWIWTVDAELVRVTAYHNWQLCGEYWAKQCSGNGRGRSYKSLCFHSFSHCRGRGVVPEVLPGNAKVMRIRERPGTLNKPRKIHHRMPTHNNPPYEVMYKKYFHVQFISSYFTAFWRKDKISNLIMLRVSNSTNGYQYIMQKERICLKKLWDNEKIW